MPSSLRTIAEANAVDFIGLDRETATDRIEELLTRELADARERAIEECERACEYSRDRRNIRNLKRGGTT